MRIYISINEFGVMEPAMGKYQRFNDYIEAQQLKGKEIIQKPDKEESLVGIDNDGPLAIHPNQPPSVGTLSKAFPYKNYDDDVKDTVWVARDDGNDDKGLGNDMSPGMTPDKSPYGKKPEGKIAHPKFVKMTSEQFVQQTKDMSSAEFAQYVLEHEQPDTQINTITDLYGNEFTPDPTQTIQYICGIMTGNHRMLERFLREMKRRSGLMSLIEELLEHPESYDMIAEMMEDDDFGDERCNKMARSMNDRYASIMDNIGFDETNLNEETDDALNVRQGGSTGMSPKKTPSKAPGGAFGGGNQPGPDAEHPATGSAWAAPGGGGSFGNGGGGPSGPGGEAGAPQSSPQGAPQFADQKPVTNPLQAGAAGGNSGGAHYMKSGSDSLIRHMSGYDHMKKSMLKHCEHCNQ